MHHHHHQNHRTQPPQIPTQPPPPPSHTADDAPPKQVALAMDRLAHAGRLIADIRLGADRLLEALFIAGESPHSSGKTLNLIAKEEVVMKDCLQELRNIGRQLEESGVLNESLRSRSNSWGLHMPLVCPDGAVVAYAWKRQLAGQAGASAVDRTRLALKAFTDQKRRFFPHLDDGSGAETVSKKPCGDQVSSDASQEGLSDSKTVFDVLSQLEKEVPTIKAFTYQRLDWLKRATLLPSSSGDVTMDSKMDHNFHGLNKLRQGPLGAAATDQISVIELLCPSIFRVVISLHPAGSLDPDAIAFFSPDEGGSYVHARGVSAFNVFKYITEHAAIALQYFVGVKPEKALYCLLHWVCCYQTLFTKVCSKCGRLLSMDKQPALLLPPVRRPYRNFSACKLLSTQHSSPNINQSISDIPAYHYGCFSDEA